MLKDILLFPFPFYRKKRFSFIKRNEVWYTVLVLDLFAVPLTILFSKIKSITPDSVSFGAFMFFTGGVYFLFTTPESNLIYTGLFFISAILDATDGKLARVRGSSGKHGAIVDALFDMICQGPLLMLAAIAISRKTNSYLPAMAIIPYSFYLGASQLNRIVDLIKSENAIQSHIWKKRNFILFDWLDNWGLAYFPLYEFDIVFFGILGIGINLTDPGYFLIGILYLPAIFSIILKKLVP